MMKKLTELQVLKALDILNFPDIPENRADLQRVSKVLQYAPTEPGAPLSGEEWNEFCLACGNDPEAWGWARIRLNCILARRNTAQPSPKEQQCDGSCDIDWCTAVPLASVAQADWDDQHGHRTEILPLIGGEPVKKEQATRYGVDQILANLRKLLEANPKTLEERIAELEHQLAEEKKDFDALDDQYHRLGEKYEEIQKIAPQSNKENSMPVGKPMDICPSCRAWIFLGAHHAEGCTRFQSKRTLENERQLVVAMMKRHK